MTQRFTYKLAPLRGTVHLDVGVEQARLLNSREELKSQFPYARAESARFREDYNRGIWALRLEVSDGKRRFKVGLNDGDIDPRRNDQAQAYFEGVALLLDRLQAARPQLRVELGGGTGERLGMWFAGMFSLLLGLGLAISAFLVGIESDEILLLGGGCSFLTLVGFLLVIVYPPGSKAPRLRPGALADQLRARMEPDRDLAARRRASRKPRSRRSVQEV